MNPVPVGVAGELWIGGDGVARGYRGRPDLTDERFIADPFAASAGARMYRTGDLARYRDDGNLEYLGRIDHQVKVRGFRIELGEIETVLASHVAVASAVVMARGSEGEAELAAYVILRGVPISANTLRQFLGQKLPGYMVPSTVTALESFPLTPNGKIDRKALPEPSRERSAELELVAPRTPLEKQLAGIWERELGISPIGVTDNFFDLGVTSIVAASLFAAIEHALGDDLPLGGIFRAPTIEALARLLESGESKSRWTSLVPIQPAGSQPPIFCVHGGGGTILHLAPLARALGEDQPFYGLQSRGLYGGVVPPSSVEDMATHYMSEMRQVHPGGPVAARGLLLRRARRLRDGTAARGRGRGGRDAGDLQRPEPELDTRIRRAPRIARPRHAGARAREPAAAPRAPARPRAYGRCASLAACARRWSGTHGMSAASVVPGSPSGSVSRFPKRCARSTSSSCTSGPSGPTSPGPTTASSWSSAAMVSTQTTPSSAGEDSPPGVSGPSPCPASTTIIAR